MQFVRTHEKGWKQNWTAKLDDDGQVVIFETRKPERGEMKLGKIPLTGDAISIAAQQLYDMNLCEVR